MAEVPPRSGSGIGGRKIFRNSENKFQSKLQLAVRKTGCADNTGVGRADRGPRQIEVRAVEGVEGLTAELQLGRLVQREAEAAVDREIERIRTWTCEHVAAGVAVGELRREDEGVDIEVALHSPVVEPAAANPIRPVGPARVRIIERK